MSIVDEILDEPWRKTHSLIDPDQRAGERFKALDDPESKEYV